jgi:hypothetical protein
MRFFLEGFGSSSGTRQAAVAARPVDAMKRRREMSSDCALTINL